MIITQLTLENYKQYRGEHTFQVAEDATVGVVGANGVGKTTLFEAIEWCLYKPTTISNHDIRPRGVGGEVRVVVQLTTNAADQVFEVERVLKRSSTQATVYRLNEFGGGEPLVQGTREVTDYISTRLIGLGHSAFVATFFTRQKELSFFGNMQPAARRREVGKLLGLETIKQAQALIAEDRSKARADADSLQRQYDAKSGDRDLKAEIEAAKEAIDTQTSVVAEATEALNTAEKRTATAEANVQRLQEKRERYNAVSSELRNLETRHQHAVERQASLNRDLEQLDKRQAERASLAREAADEPALRAERKRLEVERERFQTRERLQRDVAGCQQTMRSAIADLRSIVERTSNPTDTPGWKWSDSDQNEPIAGIDRLVAIASSVDLRDVEERLDSYREALFEEQCIDRERATLDRYQQRQEQLSKKLDDLMRDGDPDAARTDLEAQQGVERKRQSDAQATITSLTKQVAGARDLVIRLEQQHFDDACPTCGRSFSDHEAEFVIQTLRNSIQQHEANIGAAEKIVSKADQELKRLQQELKQAQAREAEIQKCQASLESSKEYINAQKATVEGHASKHAGILKRISLSQSPTQEDVAAVEKQAADLRALRGSTQPLTMLRRTIADSRQTLQERERELGALTNIQWDAEVYREVSSRHDSVSRAVSAVGQIDQELARRPQLEHDLEATKTSIAELEASVAEQTHVRDGIGYNTDEARLATEELHQARQSEREERERLAAADRAAREAGYRLESLRKDEEQLKELAEQAETRRQQKDELDLMYNEFSEFDKFVAQRLSPKLSEMTSDIVSEMTNGKYDRVEFDEDYGIKVFDETDESFALETFSGGERDAISLAARLALSRMIGAQAANPPGFIVLDEVFGSLDAERRERVLTLLGQHSHEYFRQMFIISHVDDVQQSPVFDSVWQVVQREDGTSDVVQGVGELAEAVAG